MRRATLGLALGMAWITAFTGAARGDDPSPNDAMAPAPIHRDGAPPERSRAEVDAVLKAGEPISAGTAVRPLKVVLVDGIKDHGTDEHDYPLFQQRWSALLGKADGVTVTTARDWLSAEQWRTANLVVLFNFNPAWKPERASDLDTFLARGGGLVLLHSAVMGNETPGDLAERIGLAWDNAHSKYRHGPVDLVFAPDAHSPITAGLDRLHLEDESYWVLAGDPAKVTVLATAEEDGQPRPMVWTMKKGPGRVFVSIPGHYNWTFDDPLYRVLLLRGMAWVAGEPSSRFNGLVTVGARVK